MMRGRAQARNITPSSRLPPEKKRPFNLALIGRQKRFSRACREGTTGTKAFRLDGGH